MNKISVTYTCIWQIKFAENYKLTKDGLCFNFKTGKQIKQILKCGCIGYVINGKFYSLKYLHENLVKIKTEKTPF